MLNYNDLNLIKEKVDGEKIVYINIHNKDFVFKALSTSIIDTIKKIFPFECDFEDGICNVSLVYPETYNFSECGYAGIPKKAAKEILKISYYNNEEKIFDEINAERERISSFREQCISVIKAVFIEYRIDEIEDWSWDKIARYAVRAEAIMKIKNIPIDIVPVEDKKEDEENKKPLTKKQIGNIIRKLGIDPILYYSDKYIKTSKEIMEYPFIGGLYWNKEEIINEISKQSKSKEY